MKFFTKCYMWAYPDDVDKVRYRILTDLEEGHKLFIDFLKNQGVKKILCEYLSEYDCALMGKVETIIDSEVDNNEAY